MIRLCWLSWGTLTLGDWERLSAWSTEDERLAASGLPDPVRAAAWLGGRCLLRWLVEQSACGDKWELAWDPAGRPRIVGFPDVGVSLSRTEGLVVAVLRRGGPVGLDAEALCRFGGDRVRAWEWCAREALSKGSGASLDALLDVDLEIGDCLVPGGWTRVPDSERLVDCGVARWLWCPIELGCDAVGVLAVDAESPVAVEVVDPCFGTIAP